MSAATLSARRRLAFIVLALGALLASAVLAYARGPLAPSPASAGGATIVVDTLADTLDPGAGCSLRAAILNANHDSDFGSLDCEPGQGADTITFAVSGTLELVLDMAPITNPAGLTIDGGGEVTVSGMEAYRPFTVEAGASLTLESITIIDGSADNGGGILNEGTLMLHDSTISGSEATGSGGGIYNGGIMSVVDSQISGNTAFFAGGIQNSAGSEASLANTEVVNNDATAGAGGIGNSVGSELTLAGSLVSGNEATAFAGGGIANFGDLTLGRSTVSGNETDSMGGGIWNAGTVTGVNSTLSGNTAGGDGGGLLNTFGGEVTFTNSTVTDNATSGMVGGIFNDEDVVTLANTIVADQQSGADCAGITPVSAGHNLDSDGTCGLTEDGDISEGNANLGPLADNGGPTLTHALLEGSDAIDAGDDAVCADEPVNGMDQRGAFRPHGEACDIGAFEFGAVIPLWGDIDCDGVVVIGDALKTARYLLSLSVSQEAGCPEPGVEVTVNGIDRTWGDVDCDETVAIGDALKIARWLLGLSVSQEEGCPEIGTEVFIG
jgi:CSLREA domain-containing protein